jgi:hypothetical protein
MKVVQVSKAGDWEIVEREIPQPPAGHVRIRRTLRGVASPVVAKISVTVTPG